MSSPLLELRHVAKRYPGVIALDDVSLTLERGEIHALVGENGAGKSTLMKILSGAERRDAGEITLDGEPIGHATPHQVRARGINMIYQEFSLVPTLTVAANVFLGAEPRTRLGLIDAHRIDRDCRSVLAQLDSRLDASRTVSTLSVAEKQLTEIARALVLKSRVLILDEPSATLTEHEITRLFALLRKLAAAGVGIFYITHRLEEVFALAARASVLRDGRLIASAPVPSLDRATLIRMMVGRELPQPHRERVGAIGAEVLRVAGLTRRGAFHDIGLKLHAGEIVGLAGLVGAGRSELAMALVGAPRADEGSIHLRGRRVRIKSPAAAIRLGIGLIGPDRQLLGLVPGRSIRENVALSSLGHLATLGVVGAARERAAVMQQLSHLRVKAASIERPPGQLSGGNQQKLLLARLLLCEASVLIVDEPTRGIDIGAKHEIHELLRSLCARGSAILLISSELPEVIALSDRVLVMREGRMAGELERSRVSAERVMELATG